MDDTDTTGITVPEHDLRRLGLATAFLLAQVQHDEENTAWAAGQIALLGGMSAVATSLADFWELMTEWEQNQGAGEMRS